jgi:hypothetical protein
VLLYCGYVAMTATVVVYFSSLRQQASGRGVESLFESEKWPHLGIQLLGAPLLVLLVLLGLTHSGGAGPPGTAAVPAREE